MNVLKSVILRGGGGGVISVQANSRLKWCQNMDNLILGNWQVNGMDHFSKIKFEPFHFEKFFHAFEQIPTFFQTWK